MNTAFHRKIQRNHVSQYAVVCSSRFPGLPFHSSIYLSSCFPFCYLKSSKFVSLCDKRSVSLPIASSCPLDNADLSKFTLIFPKKILFLSSSFYYTYKHGYACKIQVTEWVTDKIGQGLGRYSRVKTADKDMLWKTS